MDPLKKDRIRKLLKTLGMPASTPPTQEESPVGAESTTEEDLTKKKKKKIDEELGTDAPADVNGLY